MSRVYASSKNYPIHRKILRIDISGDFGMKEMRQIYDTGFVGVFWIQLKDNGRNHR